MFLKYLKYYFVCLCSIGFIGCQQQTESEPDGVDVAVVENGEINSPALTVLEEYAGKAAELKAALENSDDVAALTASANELTLLSVPVVDAFAEAYPECQEYLNLSKAVIDGMESMSSEVIEAQYHSDGALPETESKCYHAKDLLVHPATVVVLLRENKLATERTGIVAEITEVLAHMMDVKINLQKAAAQQG